MNGGRKRNANFSEVLQKGGHGHNRTWEATFSRPKGLEGKGKKMGKHDPEIRSDKMNVEKPARAGGRWAKKWKGKVCGSGRGGSLKRGEDWQGVESHHKWGKHEKTGSGAKKLKKAVGWNSLQRIRWKDGFSRGMMESVERRVNHFLGWREVGSGGN